LYDDSMVLPEPSQAVPDILFDNEVSALEAVGRELGPLIQALGDSPDDAYTSNERWPSIMKAAKAALRIMRQSDSRHREAFDSD